jgi:hypothetical protein
MSCWMLVVAFEQKGDVSKGAIRLLSRPIAIVRAKGQTPNNVDPVCIATPRFAAATCCQ